MEISISFNLLILTLCVIGVHGCGRGLNYDRCFRQQWGKKPERYPFFFGSMNYSCFDRFVGNHDYLFVSNYSEDTIEYMRRYFNFNPHVHRFIMYYYNWESWYVHMDGVTKDTISGSNCNPVIDPKVVGYGALPLRCIVKCTKVYVDHAYLGMLEGHDFAFKMAELLCDHKRCPVWCRRKKKRTSVV